MYLLFDPFCDYVIGSKAIKKEMGEVSFDNIENRHSGMYILIEINSQILMHIPHKKANLLIHCVTQQG